MKKRSPEGWFFDDDFFAEFERLEEMMRKMLAERLDDFEKPGLDFERAGAQGGKGMGRPRVYGFTLEFGPEGEAKFTDMTGSQIPLPRTPGSPQKQVQRQRGGSDPHFELIDRPGELSIIVELPGVEEKHLHLKAFPRQLGIRVSDPDRLFAKTLSLPAEVDGASLQSSLKNGILEITLKKKK